MALNFNNLDSTTIIAAGLGFFFLIVAMLKTFGRKNGSQMLVLGSEKPRKGDEEVKLSDPFSLTKPHAEASEKVLPVKTPLNERALEKSAFKQYTPDASVLAEIKTRDDSDYQWE